MQVLTNYQMRYVDQMAMETYHIPGIVLMEHASFGIYTQMKSWLKKSDRIQIVCGVGNNGGDGLALARLLSIDGFDVCYSLVEHKVVTEDALSNLQMVEALGIPCYEDLQSVDVIVDAIFGTGLQRDVEGNAKDWIEKMNANTAKVVSIDIPSGICSNTGEILGVAIKADITYTIARGKVGLYIYPGSEYVGDLAYIDLHVPNSLFEECGSTFSLVTNDVCKNLLPIRSRHSHKGDYGKILMIGGSRNMSGAICMAAKAALASGCGLLTCAVPVCMQFVLQTNVLESMSLPLLDRNGWVSKESVSSLPALDTYDGILIGCGMGRHADVVSYVDKVLRSHQPVVIDADGLVGLKPLLMVYKNRKDVILTPHLKEFADLMNVSVKEVEEHRMFYIDQFTKEYPNWTLVLKSETTIIASGDYRYINTSGNNGLAVGGSGDVLAGIITGMLGQLKDCVKAACVGVYLHGVAADSLLDTKSVYSIVPTDVIQEVEHILKSMAQ